LTLLVTASIWPRMIMASTITAVARRRRFVIAARIRA
jgi:hypothetical protein